MVSACSAGMALPEAVCHYNLFLGLPLYVTSLEDIWDHLKLLYIERLTVSSFLFSFYPITCGPCRYPMLHTTAFLHTIASIAL